jgi:hypothetical protein
LRLALILAFSPRRRNSLCTSSFSRLTIRPIQSRVFQRDGERFSFSLGRRPG